MHVGLAGAGRVGAVHARTLASAPGVERLTIVDVDREAAEEVAAVLRSGASTGEGPASHLGAARSEIEIGTDLDALLAAGVDALVVCTPTTRHAEHIVAGARAGVPVFCEKPIALDLPTTDAALAEVARAGVPLQIGFQRRFDAGFAEARRIVASGELGRLYVVRTTCFDAEPPPLDYVRRSGGIYRDMHIHDFDAIRFVTGDEVVEVYADGVALDPVVGAEGDVDVTALVLHLAGGALVVMAGSRRDPRGYDHRMELLGERDSVAVALGPRTPLRPVGDGAFAPSGEYAGFLDRFADAYRAELLHFLDLAAGEAENVCPGDEARHALAIAVAADRSRAQRRPVALIELTGRAAPAPHSPGAPAGHAASPAPGSSAAPLGDPAAPATGSPAAPLRDPATPPGAGP